MKQTGRLVLTILGFFLLTFSSQLYATHIVGGDLTYKCLGNGDYEVTLTVRRDCQFGDEPFDDVAHIGIFDGFGNLLPWYGTGGMIQIENPVVDTLDTSLDTGCGFIGDVVCVEQATYVGVVNLPVRTSGYYFAYQRCCRNSSLTNIVNALNTGTTYYTRLTELGLETCNNSPVFKEWPDIYICSNQSLTFDHSAIETDGDSLVYKLCAPSDGGTFDDPQPVPPKGPPYDDVVFQAPFSETDPMGGVPLTINAQTGIITGTPNTIGQFLVGVCVEEYRNGVLISSTKRDFEYNVRVCTEGPIADFDAPDLICDGLTVEFKNTSENADSYVWSFNVPSSDPAFKSFDENPTFTYTDEGVYIVSLEAIRDIDGCSNTHFDTVRVYTAEVKADFDHDISACVPDSTVLQLTDKSEDPEYVVDAWKWTITTADGFMKMSTEQNPLINVPIDDAVTITLEAFSSTGCSDILTKVVDADPLDLEILPSPAMICQGDTVAILLDPNCDVTYTIVPSENTFIDSTDCNIYIIPTEDINYTVYAENGICFDSTTLDVEIIEKSDLSIIGDEIVCNDSINLSLEGTLPMNEFDWSFNEDFNPLIGVTTSTLDIPFPTDKDSVTVYVRVKEGTGCSDVISKVLYNKSINVTYASEMVLCRAFNEEIIVVNHSKDDVTIVWDDNDIIIEKTDSSVIVYTEDLDLETTITGKITNAFGCEEAIEIKLTVEEQPTADFAWEVNCDGPTFCFENLSTGDYNYFWDFGDTTSVADTSVEKSPCYEFPGPGTYDVTMTLVDGPCEGLAVTKSVIVPEIIELSTEFDTIKTCREDTVTMSVTTNLDDLTIEWQAYGNVIGTGDSIQYTFTSSTTVKVIASDSLGCMKMVEIFIDVYLFELDVTLPEINCEDTPTDVSVTNNSKGDNYTYEWGPDEVIVSGQGTTDIVVSAKTTTDITLKVTNTDNGCSLDTSFVFNVSDIDATLYANPEEPYQCTESEIGVENPDSDWVFDWGGGKTDASFVDTVMNDTTYYVTITDENGCTEVDSISVRVKLPNCDETDVFLPSAFSPNGDNMNDVLYVRSNYIKKMNLVIYNRWGELMFQSTSTDVGWDGTFKGEAVSPDVYVFSLNVTCSNGATYKKQGNVTLIR